MCVFTFHEHLVHYNHELFNIDYELEFTRDLVALHFLGITSCNVESHHQTRSGAVNKIRLLRPLCSTVIILNSLSVVAYTC